MEKQKKKEQVSEQEEFEHFMKYLSSDSGARDAFVNLSDEYARSFDWSLLFFTR